MAFETADGWHAIALNGRSGAGKSELALELMASGARLVADDQTRIIRDGALLLADAPAPIRGMIEMRGMGLIRAAPLSMVRLSLMVNLDVTETARLPEYHQTSVLGVDVPTLYKVGSRAFPAALRQYVLTQSWLDRDEPG
ncbi:HPr kinase/phosphorylase [Roseinatronobacter alkalisoli]|uniref:Serine kinase n=1 Tax=Roseinatronobacter alkalisoli TaxID=3028235 RepID=A0ABT5T435_9RHOB|nr:serine kinase [Roseinatronobacter sp. HJB301]MDD7969878.1 serine kinase [Roseinatronobacter sp. HJB301]